jgi:hypothetical protein
VLMILNCCWIGSGIVSWIGRFRQSEPLVSTSVYVDPTRSVPVRTRDALDTTPRGINA